MKMRLLLILFAFAFMQLQAQDTFSIVAVDTLTGEIGSAGASCIDNTAIAGGAKIISDVIPGRGAIHTQSYWLAANQLNARARMLAGDSPQQIIDWLVANDAQNLPGRRQYGIVDFDENGHPRSAAFTGATSMDWKGHISGGHYAIQGNILLHGGILDSMEARFLRQEGTLADKLMAALQGANVPGADQRCLNEGVSSLSAFIRMARPDDQAQALYLDLNVPQTPYGVEPIDSLQVLYDQWKMITGIKLNNDASFGNWQLFPNPAGDFLIISGLTSIHEIRSIRILNVAGKLIRSLNNLDNGQRVDIAELPAGNYFLQLESNKGVCSVRPFIRQ